MKTKALNAAQLHQTDHEAILEILEGGHWRNTAELARWADIPESHQTCPRTRGYIRELIELGHPIVSGPGGYRLTNDKSEIVDHLEALRKRRDALDSRIFALTRAALKVRG